MITQERLKEVLSYNELDGSFTWISGAYKGCRAGHYNKIGYVCIRIDWKLYQAHRLVFLYLYGYIPKEIDHININGYDNRLVNLREVTRSQNNMNMLLRIDNTSGHKGIAYHDRGYNRNPRYSASVTIQGKTHRKYFTVKPGQDESMLQAAINWVNETRTNLHGEFANQG